MVKTLTNTDTKGAKKQVRDIEFWGDGDIFKLISKASSQTEGWMKSTKAMEIEGVGCVVQVTTQQASRNGMITMYTAEEIKTFSENDIPLTYPPLYAQAVAEAVTFVPGVKIEEEKDKKDKVISRKLVKI
jgi:hypothetical protein